MYRSLDVGDGGDVYFTSVAVRNYPVQNHMDMDIECVLVTDWHCQLYTGIEVCRIYCV
jgi:hypothetical protein